MDPLALTPSYPLVTVQGASFTSAVCAAQSPHTSDPHLRSSCSTLACRWSGPALFPFSHHPTSSTAATLLPGIAGRAQYGRLAPSPFRDMVVAVVHDHASRRHLQAGSSLSHSRSRSSFCRRGGSPQSSASSMKWQQMHKQVSKQIAGRRLNGVTLAHRASW